jgi:hypothetical protein
LFHFHNTHTQTYTTLDKPLVVGIKLPTLRSPLIVVDKSLDDGISTLIFVVAIDCWVEIIDVQYNTDMAQLLQIQNTSGERLREKNNQNPASLSCFLPMTKLVFFIAIREAIHQLQIGRMNGAFCRSQTPLHWQLSCKKNKHKNKHTDVLWKSTTTIIIIINVLYHKNDSIVMQHDSETSEQS